MIKFKLNNLKVCLQHIQKCSIVTTTQNLIWYKRLWNWMPQSSSVAVTQIGDPVLRQKAAKVPEDKIQSNEVKFIINKMINVLRNNDCVGLAAPQIGVSLQIIVMEFKEELKKEFTPNTYKLRQMDTLPLTILLNPEITFIKDNKRIFFESCASVKGYAGQVERFEEVILNGLNENGKITKIHLKGWNARIAQHEMDHLQGIIYTDKMNCLTFKCTNAKRKH